MHCVVLSNAVSADATADERDVLVQVEAVSRALGRLEHRLEHWTCTLDLDELAGRLRGGRPEVVFNLVEALAGSDRLAAAVTLLLDVLEIRYTGSPTAALLLTGSKTATKQRLHDAGLPTPAWAGPETSCPPAAGRGGTGAATLEFPRRMILKPLWEHASLGMDDSAVVEIESTDELRRRLAAWTLRLGRPCFAEDYIDGREFNVSLLAGEGGPEVLPAAEIDFSAFPAGKPRIVGYQAKWEAGSFEYRHTPRRFEFGASDGALLERLGELARRAWPVFGLGGYARVDFRVDAQGRPWILEINANPCLSPDAGFAAAIARAGLDYDAAIARLVRAATESG